MTTPSEFRRLEDLFHELIELAPEVRRARLEAVRNEAPVLHGELVRLLARDAAGAPLPPGLDAPPSGLVAGDRIGAYRLVRELGKGGMGVVFEAAQDAPLERRVAIKLVRGGLSGPRALERFESERATLARMSHPGIAQVFDAGTAPDGRPYLVMELVEGEPITRFCDRNHLDTGERIRLFREVCDAVRHAHQKGILHRDLKPGNVLVTAPLGGAPRVKVIDFGIAKLVAGTDAGPGLTRRGEIIGTPEYMSPEQARGEELDTRSDVYSLGVVLYELLTGGVPIDRTQLERASPVERARLVGTLPPQPPAARLAPGSGEIAEIAARRRTDPDRLRRELGGDVGQILLMAMRKEPERRYGSVEQLAADLERYLEGRPVSARPDSFGYRARKLIARHAAAFVASLLLVAGLAAATLFSTVMYLRADAARRDSEAQRLAAERISTFLKKTLSSVDPELAQGRDVTLLRAILDDAAARIEAEFGSTPEVAADLELTIGDAYGAIGLEELAERHLRSSLARWRGLARPRPDALAESELALGSLLHNRDRYEESERLLRSAVSRRRTRQPVDEIGLAGATAALAELLEETGSHDEAGRLFEESVALLRRAPGGGVEALATALRGYGEHLLNNDRLAESEPLLREAIAVRRAAGEQGTSLVLPLITFGRWLRWSERFEESVEPMREAVEIARRELPEDHPQRLEAISELANSEQHRGDHEAAEALYREALAAQTRIHGGLHSAVATTTNNLASLLREVGRLDEAERLFADAAAGYVASFGADHYWVSIARLNRGRTLFALGRLAAAERELEEALRVRRLQESSAWRLADVEVVLAACRVARGEIGDAEATLERGLATLREHYGERTWRAAEGTRALAEIYERSGRAEQAAALRETLGDPPPPRD